MRHRTRVREIKRERYERRNDKEREERDREGEREKECAPGINKPRILLTISNHRMFDVRLQLSEKRPTMIPSYPKFIDLYEKKIVYPARS